MSKYLGIDIGGSSVKYGVLSEEGEFLERGSIKSNTNDFSAFREALASIITWAKNKYSIEGVAISAPGGVDSDTGLIGGTSALPCIHGPNFKKVFGEELGIRVEIENDANCCALGEVWKGAAKENKDVLFVVCGTGIGGAVIKNRQLHRGSNLHGGEFGYTILDWKNENGRLELRSWSSLGATGALVARVAQRKGIGADDIDGKEIFKKSMEGDQECLQAVEDFYFYNALGIFNLQYIYDPEKILVGGAISSREDFIFKLKEKIDLIMEAHTAARVRPIIEKCFFENDANIIGALYHYLSRKSIYPNEKSL